MNFLKLITDLYERKARLYPALLVLLPPILAVVAFIGGELDTIKVLLSILGSAGCAFFLAQVARDSGKKKENLLFKAWGGMPSIAIFRYRDSTLDSITKQRYHKAMETLVPESSAPTEKNEKKKPDETDEIYSAWSNYLRTHTRDKARFPLIFSENVNYGYRRNAWGMKAWGIRLSLLSAISISIGNPAFLYFWENQKFWQLPIDALLMCAFLLSIGFLLFWIFRVDESWVKIPADAYAKRLVESIEELSPKSLHFPPTTGEQRANIKTQLKHDS